MPIQWSETKKTEIQGLNYVQRIVNDSGCIFNKVDGTNDIGLDGYIEFNQDNSPTGLCIGIQVKAGNSNLSRNNEVVSLKTDRNHFEYWHNHILPIVAVVYIPKDENAYWLDITQYLADDEDIVDQGPYTIQINKANIFDVDNFPLFYYQLRKYLSSYGDDKFFGRSLRFLADLNSRENRYGAIKSLFSFHRNKLETWHYLISSFCFENDTKMQLAFIYAYRHLMSHGNIHWHPGNIMDWTIIDEAKQLIPKYFGLKEISKLLNHIEEDGISQGSIGFEINFIIRLIPDRVEFLKEMILNPKTIDDKRFWSAICLIDEFQEYDLQRAFYFAESMQTNFPSSIHVDRFVDIKNSLAEFVNIDFGG